MKKFDILYFGLWTVLFAFVIYTAIDVLPSFEISTTLVTPNSSVCSYEGPYDSATGIFQCASGPTSSSIFTPSHYDYIIYMKNGFTIAYNGNTGNIDFNSTNSASVIQSSISALPSGGNIFVKYGTYYVKGHIQVNSQVSIYGEGKQNTIFIRQYNVSNDVFTVIGNYTKLKDFTIDGNAINNLSNTGAEEIGVTGSYFESNVKIINYAHGGFASTGKHNILNDCVIIANRNINGTSYGIWDATNTSILTVNNCDIENNWLGAIYAGGYTIFENNYISNNHRQTSPTGGGQVAADTYQNIFFGVYNNQIINRGGIFTDGVEIGAHDAIISGNYITGQDNGISIDYNPSHVIIDGNMILHSLQKNINTNNVANVTIGTNFLG